MRASIIVGVIIAGIVAYILGNLYAAILQSIP